MPLNIPMPSLDRGGLFEGLFRANQDKMARDQMLAQQQYQQYQLEQQLKQHQENMMFKQLTENRAAKKFENEQSAQPYKIDLVKAKTDAEIARAEKLRRDPMSSYKPSELERISAILSDNNPERRKALLAEGAATKYGLTLPGAENLPVGSQPFKSLPKNLQAQENADQIKMQTRVNDAIKANHDLDKMQKIIDSNPDMARDFTYILGNPEDKNFINNMFRRYSDKKKQAAVELFTKYSNDFVLSAGNGLGNNFTDAKLKALQLSKMHAGNTDIANKALIGNYKTRLKPLINYGSELKKARGKYTLPYFEDSYSDEALGKHSIQSLSDEELEAL